MDVIATITSLHRAHAVIARLSDHALKREFGFGGAQSKILWVLHVHRDGVHQNDIANYLNQTDAATSRQVQLLQDQGLIWCEIEPGNRRSHRIGLTDKGRETIAKVLKLLEDVHAPLFASLSESDVAACNTVLAGIFQAACAQDNKERNPHGKSKK